LPGPLALGVLQSEKVQDASEKSEGILFALIFALSLLFFSLVAKIVVFFIFEAIALFAVGVGTFLTAV
jgi:hypothetical protein